MPHTISPEQQLTIQPFATYADSLTAALDELAAPLALRAQTTIIIKPNLVNASPFPVTTHPELIRALVHYLRAHSQARIILAEGCGDAHLETTEVFKRLGYTELARECGLELLDLNHAELVRLTDADRTFFPEIHLPRIVFNGLLISVAVLKRHSLARVTLGMKNMLGLLPPSHYQCGGSWKKSALHGDMQRSIFEMNLYRAPDLSIVDASLGLASHHLGGPACSPAVNKILAGFDPVAVDAAGSDLLGVNWRDVGHIRMAHGVLGQAVTDAAP
jgi:uncharacterized protein (DUF362 family)